MRELLAISFSLILGLLIYLSLFLYSNKSRSEKELSFISSFSLIILIIITFFEILPLAIKILNNKFILSQSIAFIFLICIFIYLIIKSSYYYTNNSTNIHNEKIQILIFLTLFYLISGFNLYSITLIGIRYGLLNLIKYGVQNISLALLFIGLYKNTYKKLTKIFGMFLTLPLIGSLISYIFNVNFESKLLFGIINSIIFSLALYIIIYKLLKEFKQYNDKKSKAIGIIFGGVLMLVLTLF